jgi:nucleoside-diphosphate-sugar epimerase
MTRIMQDQIEKCTVVTGGAGFVGSHLCEQLLALGRDVLCVDNFFTGSRANIRHLLDCHNFEVLRRDITFPLYVETEESTTSHARLRQSIINSIRYRRPRQACMVR